MKIKKTLIILFTMLIIYSTATACTESSTTNSQEVDNIKIELIDISEQPTGLIYTIKLKNLSKHTIKQNNLYLSYPFKTNSGGKGNDFKVEAKNNKLDIKPKEEIMLTLFSPKEEYDNNKLDINNFYIEIVGYLDKIKDENRFQKIGGIDYFK